MKTHQERSEEAAAAVRRAVETTDGGLSVRLAPGDWVTPGGAVARLAYPTELVEAAPNASCVSQVALEGYALPTQEDLSDLRAALALYDKETARPVCDGCGREIDPETCGCGSARVGHIYEFDGHPFIPMGCDCYRSKPPGEPGKEG
jgi:hypothetical protein